MKKPMLFSHNLLSFYNRKFAVLHRSLDDAHALLDPSIDLDSVFSIHQIRIISTNFEIQFNHVIYQIITSRPAYSLKGREVLATHNQDGQVNFYLNGKFLKGKPFHKRPKQALVVSSKPINHISFISAPDQPWRTYPSKLTSIPNPLLE